ncbi:MAG TPA: hypothetical protein VGI16_07740 [Candidatus Acidoferrum sp.]
MTTLTQLQQNRRIIHDFTTTTLAVIPSQFARLIHLAALRDLSSGRYKHAGLSALYSEEPVQQALAQCHEEVFEKILETPLQAQQEDLRGCFAEMDGGVRTAAKHWQRFEAYRMLVPVRSPEYLKELFCSNLRALLTILEEEFSTVHSGA